MRFIATIGLAAVLAGCVDPETGRVDPKASAENACRIATTFYDALPPDADAKRIRKAELWVRLACTALLPKPRPAAGGSPP